MTFNLATILRESALAHPGKFAVRTRTEDVTYRELDERSGRVAAALLDAGLRRGDRVAVRLPNVPQFLVAYFGILKAGLVMVPMNPLLTAAEAGYQTSHSGARLVLDDPAEVDLLAEQAATPVPPVGTEPGDPAVVIYTSGTTGRPKGAVLTHFSLFMSSSGSGATTGVREDDVTVSALPLFHVYGLNSGVNIVVRYGMTLSLVERFDPAAVLDALERHGGSITLGVPTMYHALLGADVGGRDLGRYRMGSCGGASIPAAVLTAYEERFGIVICEGFGMSETSSTSMVNRPDERRAGSVGKPLWGMRARIAGAAGTGPQHVGELQFQGVCLFQGYLDDPAATAETYEDGWFRTGDLGYVDDDGFYFVVDRLKDLVIRGGYNVYPREIEEVLYRHPGIAEAAVIGRPDERLGEEVVAVIVRRPGARLSAEEVVEYCKQYVAPYKYPREVRFVDALPKTASGKVLKRELRDARQG